MSFLSVLLEYKWTILFYTFIIGFVYFNKKRFEKQAAFVYLYKTKIGLKFMDKVSKKFRKLIQIWGYIGIFIAYMGFFLITYALLRNAYDLIIEKPGVVGGSPVIPGLPIAGLGIKFPLVIGWISLFIIMIVHEFSHGIVARAHNVKVKSSGIAFFGPILGAFVEPDDKQLEKQPHKVQHSIFAAGPVSNIVLWIVCSLLIVAVAQPIIAISKTTGVQIGIIQNETLPAYTSGMPEKTIIIKINDYETNNLTALETALDNLVPGQEIDVYTKSGQVYKMVTTTHPQNKSRAYLGILIYNEDRVFKNDTLLNKTLFNILMWLLELLQWTAFISINIGLINLFPIFITDGAQMLKRNFEYFFKDKKRALKYWSKVNLAAVFVIMILLFLPLLRTISKLITGIIF